MDRSFALLPAPLRAALLHGCEGAQHLAEASRLARESGLEPLAASLALAAWTRSPLDASLAAAVAAAAPTVRTAVMSPVMPDSMANGSAFAGGQPAHGLTGALASLVVQSSRAPANLDYYVRLAARREHGKIRPGADPGLCRIHKVLLTSIFAIGQRRYYHLPHSQGAP